MNKMDRSGSSFRSSLLSILSHRLHPKPTVLTLPVASFESLAYLSAEPGIHGIIDLVKWELWKWHNDGTCSRHLLPSSIEEIEQSKYLPPDHPLLPHLLPARTALLENLAMFSEEFMETLLELPSGPSSYLSIPPDTIIPTLRTLTLQNKILPVLCGSAMKHIGTELVLDYAGELLASPLDVPQVEAVVDQNQGVQLLAWKVGWDKRKGWMTFVRVYSGAFVNQTRIIHDSKCRWT